MPYTEAAVDRVRFFQDMYAAGLLSRNIAALLPCIASDHTNAEQRAMLHSERARIHDRITRLQAARRRLDDVIALHRRASLSGRRRAGRARRAMSP